MSTAHLPFMPLNIASLVEAPWFLNSDANVVRAGLYLLDSAWRSSLPGSVPSSFPSLCQITRLSEAQLQSQYDLLTHGWELREDGRLHHVALSELASGVLDRFGDQLEVLAQSAVVSMQSVEAFDLVPTDAVKKTAKKRQSAKVKIEDFRPDAASLASIVAGGYRSQEHQDWLSESFRDYISSKNPKYKDIQATFRNFAASSFTHNSFRSRFGAIPSAFLRSEVALGQPSAAVLPQAQRSFAARSLDENRAVLARMRNVPGAHIQAGPGPATFPQAPTRPVPSRPAPIKPFAGPPAHSVRPVAQGSDGVFDFQGQS